MFMIASLSFVSPASRLAGDTLQTLCLKPRNLGLHVTHSVETDEDEPS
jgi:hypothetical protein